jgi:peptidoglycan/LPS O-acetylase OafA/YrhL
MNHTASSYRPEIDGLRAISVIAVILFHSDIGNFSRGFIGVDIFFVISGYLITRLIAEQLQQGTFRFADFYERRARRILPALLFVLLCTMVPAWLWMSPGELERYSVTSIAAVFFVANMTLWQSIDYFHETAIENPLLHLWSLSVEEQYYLVFPLFIWAIWKYRPGWLLTALGVCALASLGISEWGWRNASVANYYLSVTRAWELLAGAICAVLLLRKHLAPNHLLSIAGLAAVLATLFAPGPDWPVPSVYTVVPIGGTMLVILFGSRGSFAYRLLSIRPLVGIGLISYSLYLWHQPILAFVNMRSLDSPAKGLIILAILVAFILAWATWRWVERPFRISSAPASKRLPIVLPMALMAAAIVAIGALAVGTDGMPSRVNSAVLKLTNYNVENLVKATERCFTDMDAEMALSKFCRIGKRKGKPTIALIGDSHALALTPVLDRELAAKGITAIGIFRGGCPPVVLPEARRTGEADSLCKAMRRRIYASLTPNSDFPAALPQTLIISSRWPIWLGQGSFDNGEGGEVESGGTGWSTGATEAHAGYSKPEVYAQSIRTMLASGRKVILVYTVPEMGWLVPTRLLKTARAKGGLSTDSASIAYNLYLKRTKAAHAAFDSIGEHPNLVRIRPSSHFCNRASKGRCAAHYGDHPLYVDDDHVSDVGAKLIVDDIMGHL